jgi:hypothetical protein
MEELMEHFTPSGRREFLKLVGLAGLTTTLGAPAQAMAQAAKSMATPADTTKAAAPEPPSDDAKALASIIQRRYGKYLDADQMKDVTDELDGRIKAGQALRAVKLANGDEPDFRFKA